MMGVLLSQEMKAKGEKLVLICALFVINSVYHFYLNYKFVVVLICVVAFSALSCWLFYLNVVWNYLALIRSLFFSYSTTLYLPLSSHILSYLILPYYHITSSLLLSILTYLLTWPFRYMCVYAAPWF